MLSALLPLQQSAKHFNAHIEQVIPLLPHTVDIHLWSLLSLK